MSSLRCHALFATPPPPPHPSPPSLPSSCYCDPFPGPWTPTHPGLAASYGPGTDRAGLLVPAEDLGDTTVRNSQLSRDYARSDAVVGHLHYLVSDVIWQGPPVDEHSAKLVHPTLAQRRGYCATTINNKSLNKQHKQHKLHITFPVELLLSSEYTRLKFYYSQTAAYLSCS